MYQNNLTVPKGFRQFEVRKIDRESELIKSFYLYPVDGEPLDTFLPGQYLTFRLEIPGEKKPLLRTFSLSSDPAETGYYRVSIKRELPKTGIEGIQPGLTSNWFHDHVSVGSKLIVRSPRGKFYLDPQSNIPVVLLSAGIGITPLLSMLYSISDRQQAPESWFIHGARNSKHHSMKAEVIELVAAHEKIKHCFFYSQPLPEDALDTDYQFKGRIECHRLKKIIPHKNFEFYLCGPGHFIESLYSCLLVWGVPDENIHYESFGPASIFRRKDVLAKVSQESVETSEEGTINVTFSESGKTVPWDDSYESILECAEAQGLEPDYGCREGRCHTCECTLLEGKVKYIDEDVDPGTDDTVLICSSVPVTNIAIDL